MDGTVLVADDDRTIRTVLTQALTRAGCKVNATSSLMTLMRWVEEGKGDLVISDVMMPDGNGIDTIPAIRRMRPDLPVIVISAQNTIVTAIRATEAEAFDYLPKPFDLDELEARIRALARRAAPTLPGASAQAPTFCGLRIDAESGAICHDDRPMDLTARELALLRALLARPGQAVAKERLFELVFPGEREVQTEAIEVVVYRLRKKLAQTGVQLVTLRGLGYLLKAAPAPA